MKLIGMFVVVFGLFQFFDGCTVLMSLRPPPRRNGFTFDLQFVPPPETPPPVRRTEQRLAIPPRWQEVLDTPPAPDHLHVRPAGAEDNAAIEWLRGL